MFKYEVGQFAKVKGEWFEIVNLRFGMFNGQKDYLLSDKQRTGWVAEEEIEEVSEGQKTIH
jgi:hypothetical protein